jgi:uncharacterized protein (TIGR00299 family) protein
MILGALLDVGLGVEWLRELVDGLPLEVNVEVRDARRGSLAARSVTITSRREQPLRRLPDLLEIVESAPVGSDVRAAAARVIERLADVEAHLHGVKRDDVHFHEVGAVDTIVDVLGCCGGVAELGVESCFTRPVAIGSGTVQTVHGELPLPAPATLRLLEGLPVRASGFEGELTTPTGAALLAELAGGAASPGRFVPLRSGLGAGTRDPGTHPNVLRVILAELRGETGDMYMLQCDIDDMSPEDVPPFLEGLRDVGAVDVITHPVGMKKARTGVRIEALVPAGRRLEACRLFLEESTTLGVRFWPVARETSPRGTRTIEWRGFPVRVKTSVTPQGHLRVKVEYEDVIEVARATGLPVHQVREQVQRELDRGKAGI